MARIARAASISDLEPLQLEQEFITHNDIALQTRNRKTWKAFLHP